MTTIIYKTGRLYADRRVTFFRDENGVDVKDSVTDEFGKIIEPKNLYIGTKKILALATAGDINWINYCNQMSAKAVECNEHLDIRSPEFTSSMLMWTKFNTQMIAVTATRVFLITLQGFSAKFEEFPLTSWFVIGTGIETPGIGDTTLMVSPEVAMADAMAFDPMTGGDMDRWVYGRQGVVTVSLNSTYSKFTRKMMRGLKVMRDLKDVGQLIKARLKVYPRAAYV